MAYLEQRGDSTIRVCWRLGGGSGRKQSAPFSGDDPRAVRELAERARKLVEAHDHRITREEVLREILDDPDPGLQGVPLLRDWAATWVESRRPLNPDRPGEDEIQVDTLNWYETLLQTYVLPYLGHKYLTEIDEDTVRAWVTTLRKARVHRTRANPGGKLISANTVRRAHTVLRMVMGAAVPRHLPRNPLALPAGSKKNRVSLPKPPPFEGMFLRPWEHEAIHRHCPAQIADLWFVLVRTGLRLGEALALRPADVTVEGKNPEIRVYRALKSRGAFGPPKSLASRRVVTISTDVAAVLAARCKGLGPYELLFQSPEGKVWSKNNLRRRYFLPAVARAMRCPEHPPPAPPKPARGRTRDWRLDEVSMCGCPGVLQRRPRIHDARHTHASMCIVVGKLLPVEVQQRLGHSSVTLTLNVYTHLWEGVEKERLDAMEREVLARGVDDLASLARGDEDAD